MDTYKVEITERMSPSWMLVQEYVHKAQKEQKTQHDRHAKDPSFREGDRVYVHMPADCLGKAYKFARPFKGPYQIIRLFANGAEVRLISKPQAGTIRVALN